MKKLTIVLLTVMMWFNTLTVNVLAENEEIINEEVVSEKTNEVLETPDSGESFDEEKEEEIIVEEIVEDETSEENIPSETEEIIEDKNNSIEGNAELKNELKANIDEKENLNALEDEADIILGVGETVILNETDIKKYTAYSQNFSSVNSDLTSSNNATVTASRYNSNKSIKLEGKAVTTDQLVKITFTIDKGFMQGKSAEQTLNIYVKEKEQLPTEYITGGKSLIYNGLDQELVTLNDEAKDYVSFYCYNGTRTQTQLNYASYSLSYSEKDAGTYYIYWKCNLNDKYLSTSPSTSNVVTSTIAQVPITIKDIPNQAYTGNKIEPTIEFEGAVNGETFAAGNNKDYTVSYKDNKNKGTATATVTWKNQNYSLAVNTKTFEIVDKARITNSPTAYNNLKYNGQEKQLLSNGATVSNGKAMYCIGTVDAAGDDWKEKISDIKATNVGTYYVWYKAVGNEGYEDSDLRKVSVSISSVALGNVALDSNEFAYEESVSKKPTITVKDSNGNTLFDGYTITYKDHDDQTIEDSTDVGTYTVVVTPDGTNVIGDVKTADYTIYNPYDLANAEITVAVHANNESYTGVYNGEEQTLTKDNLTVQVKGVDVPKGSYEIDSDNTDEKVVNAGSNYKLTIKATEDAAEQYKGNKETTWTIDRQELETSIVKAVGPFTYDGTEKQGAVVDDDKYTLEGEISAINAGTHNFTATVTSNYKWKNNGNNDAYEVSWTINRADLNVLCVNDTNPCTLVYSTEDQVLVRNSTDDEVGFSYYIANSKQNSAPNNSNYNKTDVNDVIGNKPGNYYVYWKAAGNDNYKEYSRNKDNYVYIKIEAAEKPENVEFVANPENTASVTWASKDDKLGLVIKPTNGKNISELTLKIDDGEEQSLELNKTSDGYITNNFVEIDNEKPYLFTAITVDVDETKLIELPASGYTVKNLKESLNVNNNRKIKFQVKDDGTTLKEYGSSVSVNLTTSDIDETKVYQYQGTNSNEKYPETWTDFKVNYYYSGITTEVIGIEDTKKVSFRQRISENLVQNISNNKIYTKYQTEIAVTKMPFMTHTVKVGDITLTDCTVDGDKEVYVVPNNYLKDNVKLSVEYSFNSKIVIEQNDLGEITYEIKNGTIKFTATPTDFYAVDTFVVNVTGDEIKTIGLTEDQYTATRELGVLTTKDISSLFDLNKNNTYTLVATYREMNFSDLDPKNIYQESTLYDNTLLSTVLHWETRHLNADIFKTFEAESIDGSAIKSSIYLNLDADKVYRYRQWGIMSGYSEWKYFGVQYYTTLDKRVFEKEGETLTSTTKYNNNIKIYQNDEEVTNYRLITSYDTLVTIDVPYKEPHIYIQSAVSNKESEKTPITGRVRNDDGSYSFIISKDNYNSKGLSNLFALLTDGDTNLVTTIDIELEEKLDFLEVVQPEHGSITTNVADDGISFVVYPTDGYMVTGLNYVENIEDVNEEENTEIVNLTATEEGEEDAGTPIELSFTIGNGRASSEKIAFDSTKKYIVTATVEPEVIPNGTKIESGDLAGAYEVEEGVKCYRDYEGNLVNVDAQGLYDTITLDGSLELGNNKVTIEYFCLDKDNYSDNKDLDIYWRDISASRNVLDGINDLRGKKYHAFGEGYDTDDAGNSLEIVRVHVIGKDTNKELSDAYFFFKTTLKDTRIPIAITNNSTVTVTYDPINLKSAIINGAFDRITCFDVSDGSSEEKTMEELELTSDDFDFQDLPENASLFTQNIHVYFKGNDTYKPATDQPLEIKVRVNRAVSNLDIRANTRKYNGLNILDSEDLIIDLTPTYPNPALNPAYAYIISGITADLEGYVSVHVDTTKMVYKLPDSTELINELINQILGSGITIPENIKTLLEQYKSLNEESRLGEVIDWLRSIGIDIPSTEKTRQAIIDALVNQLLPDNFKNIYSSGTINYGNIIVDLIQVAIDTGNSVKLSNYLDELKNILNRFKIDQSEQFSYILTMVNKALEIIESANRTKLYINDKENRYPKDAGIYSIFGSTIDRNYYPELTIDTFTIESHFDGSIEWNQVLGNKLIGNVYHLTVRSLDGKTLEELKEIFGAKYNVPDGYKGGETQEHIDETTPKYLYFGSEITTEEEIKNIVSDIQNIKSLEDINNIIKKYNNIYVGNDINNIDLNAGGIYIEVVYVYGNYIEAAARIFTIERVDTKIELDDIKVTYSGKEGTYNAISGKLNSETNNIVLDKDTNTAIKDDEDNLVRPELYFVGLQVDGKFIAPTKDIPTNAGSYLMFARFAGTKFYKGSNIFEDEAKDIIEVMQTINADNFATKIRELGLPVLTIERKDVVISWNEKARETGNVDLLNVFHYTYDGKPLSEYYNVEGLIDGDAVKLSVTGDDNNAGYHTMLFTLSGDSALNYDINTSILSTSTLTYEIEKRKLVATWNEDKAAEINGAINNGVLTFEYSGQKPTVDYIVLGNTVEGDDVSARIISGATDDACQTILNHELLIGLTGEDADNYYLTDLLVLDLDYKALPYRINPRPIKVSWIEPGEGDDYTIEDDNVLTYVYNGDINYLTDHQDNNKFKVEYAGELENPTGYAFIDGDDASVDISNGTQIHVGKYDAEFSLFGRNDSKNYVIVEGSKLPYEITPKHIQVSYIDSLSDVDKDGIVHYIYNGERQYPTNSLLKLAGTLDNDQVYPAISLNWNNIYTVYNSIDASDDARVLDITLIGSSARDYVLDDATIKYVIDQRPVYVRWIQTAFNYDGNSKSPLYSIENIVNSDRRKTHIELSYSTYGLFGIYNDAPEDIGTYVAYVTGIDNTNYKLIDYRFYDNKVIFNICDSDTVYGRKISIGSVSSDDLKDKGVTAEFTNMPKMEQGISLLDGLWNKSLLRNFTNLSRNRLMHLNLESDYVDIYSERYETKLALAEQELSKSIVSKTFFFNLDLYADVTGIISKERVHETNSNYELEITVAFDKDSDVVKNIIGNNKNYYVIRMHKGKLEFLDVKVTSDDNNYYFTFKSDKFSTYGIFSKDKPKPAPYIVPKTGVN